MEIKFSAGECNENFKPRARAVFRIELGVRQMFLLPLFGLSDAIASLGSLFC